MLESNLRQSDNVQKPKPAAPGANLLRDSSLMAGHSNCRECRPGTRHRYGFTAAAQSGSGDQY
jgi:hypothetical protein